jgi:aldose sugar dehydrogenase
MLRNSIILAIALISTACSPVGVDAKPKKNAGQKPFVSNVVADFDEPWAMTFLPGSGVSLTTAALVTEKKGKLLLVDTKAGTHIEVSGVPAVDYGGQGGLGDVIAAPSFAADQMIYLSWVEAGDKDTRGAVVGSARLVIVNGAAKLDGLKIIWRQTPKVEGRGHYGHRLAFSPDGKYLYIASGERQKFDPAQDMQSNLGKIIRIFPDGSIPEDNPFVAMDADYEKFDDKPPEDMRNATRQIWSLGHRNPLGIAFDNKGQLWNQEMGPEGGDELNLVKRGANYGYPKASNGRNYGAATDDLPDHKPSDGFEAPMLFWNPAISPGGLMFYDGTLFPKWKNSMFIGGLGAESLVRVQLNGAKATKADEWPMGTRIREVEKGPDGAVWLLEDGARGSKGRLLKLTPAG